MSGATSAGVQQCVHHSLDWWAGQEVQAPQRLPHHRAPAHRLLKHRQMQRGAWRWGKRQVVMLHCELKRRAGRGRDAAGASAKTPFNNPNGTQCSHTRSPRAFAGTLGPAHLASTASLSTSLTMGAHSKSSGWRVAGAPLGFSAAAIGRNREWSTVPTAAMYPAADGISAHSHAINIAYAAAHGATHR